MKTRLWGVGATMLAAALLVFFVTIALARPAQVGSALPPGQMTHQGYLVQDNQPISGTVALRFGIYPTGSGGAALWEETHNSVPVNSGYYAVTLGATTPLTAGLFSDPVRYLQVSVDLGVGFTELPRQQLTSVPYAFQAAVADYADNAGQAVQAATAGQASVALSATLAASADYAIAAGFATSSTVAALATQATAASTAGSAATASSAPWSGLTGVPAGFADDIDDTGGAYHHVIVVSPSGGDYTSVSDALASISGSSAESRYLVWVGPGVYTETTLLTVPSYVHLQGAGRNATRITGNRTSGSPNTAAAIVELVENSRISDIAIRNISTGTFGIGIYSTSASRATVADNVMVEATGSGGVGHYALYLNDAEIVVHNSILRASGAVGFGTSVNAAIGIVNISGGFPRPLIQGSWLYGGNGDSNGLSCAGNSGTGFAVQGVNAAPDIFESYLCGDRRTVFMGTNGQVRIHRSDLWVSSTAGSFMVETTSSATVLVVTSGVFYAGNKFTGTGGLVCTHNYLSNYTAASDGSTSGTACN
jgi:hypothetical protein